MIVMEVINSQKRLREALSQVREEHKGETIGLVPTMGGLHEGHFSLIRRCVRECSCTVVSVFLNPTQFNNPTDLATYPHDMEEDLRALEALGVDFAFTPTPEEMYAKGEEAPDLPLGQVAEVMEGAYRPGHFQGVVWIVGKLFRLVQPDKAYFGLKDFQQIAVIKRMIELSDDMDPEIISCETVRESDGLAMSSRNNRLSPEERQAAPMIYRALTEGVRAQKEGSSVSEVHDLVIREIEASPLLRVEYFSIVDRDTLGEISEWSETEHAVGAITVYDGEVRLIDHIDFF